MASQKDACSYMVREEDANCGQVKATYDVRISVPAYRCEIFTRTHNTQSMFQQLNAAADG
jgi:hypothetical protein